MEKLFIRVDMNDIIATGHVMRCISIADAAKTEGIESVFILADEQAEEFVTARGYEAIVLNTDWNDLDNEIPSIKALVKEKQITKLLVDTYQVTEKYLNSLSSVTEVCYIDDLGVTESNISRLVCYSHFFEDLKFSERYAEALKLKKINHTPKMALGSDYVPLRAEFNNLNNKQIKNNIEELLIMSGGTDQYNVINRILDCIDINKYKHITAICGRYSKHYDELVNKYADTNVSILYSVNNMCELMQKADVAISAAGTTIYELCACGTPGIIYTLADNQEQNAKNFHNRKIMSYAGDARTESFEQNIEKLLNEYSDYNYRHEKSLFMKIDGCGAKRIVEFIFAKE